MALGAIIGGVAGGLLGMKGAKDAGKAQLEAVREQKKLPDWLAPYYVGQAGPAPQPIPINYNWLDAIQQMGQTGMPVSPPPMSMNDPRMTFANVYTPYAGGPWGYGLGPGVSTLEAGIPGAPGSQFLQPPDGFTPGLVAPVAPPAAENGSQGLLTPEVLEQAKNAIKWQGLAAWGQGGTEDTFMQPMSVLDAIGWAQGNPDATYVDMARQVMRGEV